MFVVAWRVGEKLTQLTFGNVVDEGGGNLQMARRLGVYEQDGDRIRICLGTLNDKRRPTSYGAENGQILITLHRVKPGKRPRTESTGMRPGGAGGLCPMTTPDFDRSFRFAEDALQRKLRKLVQASCVPHAEDADGTLRYSCDDTEHIEYDLVGSIREELFAEWRVFTLEGDDVSRPAETERYRRYMLEHGIRYHEERQDGFVWYLIDGDQDSHEWEVPTD